MNVLGSFFQTQSVLGGKSAGSFIRYINLGMHSILFCYVCLFALSTFTESEYF